MGRGGGGDARLLRRSTTTTSEPSRWSGGRDTYVPSDAHIQVQAIGRRVSGPDLEDVKEYLPERPNSILSAGNSFQLRMKESEWLFGDALASTPSSSTAELAQPPQKKPPWRLLCFLPIFPPTSSVVWYWNLFARIWDITYTSFIIPASLAFVTYPTDMNWISVLDLTGGVVFSIDILMQLRTGFEVVAGGQRKVVMEAWSIFRYDVAENHLVTDLLSVLPSPMLTWLILTGHKESWVGSHAQVIQLFLLLRLSRVWRFFIMVQVRGGLEVLYKVFSTSALYALNTAYTIAALLNFMACLMLWTATHVEGTDGDTWLKNVDGKDLSGASWGEQYIAALYFATTTLSSCGYGDIVPITPVEKLVCVLIMVAGLVFFGWLVSSFMHTMQEGSNSTRSATLFRKKLDGVECWAQRRKMPRPLTHRIKMYHVEAADFDQGGGEVECIEELPCALREDVIAFLTRDIMDSSSVFGVLSETERDYLCRRMQPVVLRIGHDLFKEGDPATGFYLLQEGELLLMDHGMDLVNIKAPAFVGETAVLVRAWSDAKYRMETARAMASCLLWEVKLSDLEQARRVFPGVEAKLRAAVRAHLLEGRDALRRDAGMPPAAACPTSQPSSQKQLTAGEAPSGGNAASPGSHGSAGNGSQAKQQLPAAAAPLPIEGNPGGGAKAGHTTTSGQHGYQPPRPVLAVDSSPAAAVPLPAPPGVRPPAPPAAGGPASPPMPVPGGARPMRRARPPTIAENAAWEHTANATDIEVGRPKGPPRPGPRIRAAAPIAAGRSFTRSMTVPQQPLRQPLLYEDDSDNEHGSFSSMRRVDEDELEDMGSRQVSHSLQLLGLAKLEAALQATSCTASPLSSRASAGRPGTGQGQGDIGAAAAAAAAGTAGVSRAASSTGLE